MKKSKSGHHNELDVKLEVYLVLWGVPLTWLPRDFAAAGAAAQPRLATLFLPSQRETGDLASANRWMTVVQLVGFRKLLIRKLSKQLIRS